MFLPRPMTPTIISDCSSAILPSWWTPRLRSLYAMVAMCLAVVVIYCPFAPQGAGADSEWALSGSDYFNLHARRLRYAREALFGTPHHLPGWYPHELGGTPFWSNIQNFPLIPTRLLLLPIDPNHAFAGGVQMAATLAALFTYLYCRRLGLGRVASAVGGWTFACSGFFASRIRVGHLPLLEAYPALPLLLWVTEVNLQSLPGDRRSGLKLLAGAVASHCVALAGHPQIPIYSLLTVGLYILWRGRSRKGAILAAAMLLGIGLGGVSLYPMLLLVRRSTRVLALDQPLNDVAFPYGRLLAFLFPWQDGWPATVNMPQPHDFTGYPEPAYFWETVGYIGRLPIIACVLLAVRAGILGKCPGRVWIFFTTLGALALALALPAVHAIMLLIPGTLLRSPARQIYLTTFALAMASAATADLYVARVSSRRAAWAKGAVAVALALHVCDLGYFHDRAFVTARLIPQDTGDREARVLKQKVGPQRIAIDHGIAKPYNREIDDVGFFDSLILAKPYRALMEVTDAIPKLNVQNVDGSQLLPRALRFFGVNCMVTESARADLPRLSPGGGLDVYDVPNPLPRASIVTLEQAEYLSNDEIHRRLAQQDFELADHLLLPADAPRPPNDTATSIAPSLTYRRDSADQITIALNSPWPTYLRLLETWDPGWSATLDGSPIPLIAAYDVFMAVPVPAGSHTVRVTFATPGASTGLGISAICLVLLSGLCWMERRAPLTMARDSNRRDPRSGR